ncbi:MAG: hypothetical protein ABI670_05730 [Chloroflexota bacterium]
MNNNQDFGQFLKQLMKVDPRRLLPMIALALLVLIVGSLSWGWWFFFVGLAFYALFYYLSLRNVFKGMSAGMGGPGQPGITPLSAYDLNKLDDKYRAYVQKALDTRASIERTVEATGDPGTKRALQDATRDLPEMLDTIYALAIKSQSVGGALRSSNTMQKLSDEIKQLDEQIKSTQDEFLKGQYYSAMDGKLQQMQNMTDTTVALNRWDAQMDNALSALDTILSQVLRIKSSEVLSYTGATDDVSRTLRQQVDSLKATSDAMDSVYGMSNR